MLLWGDPSWKQALFGSRVWAPPKLVCKLARSGRGGRASGRAPFFGCLGGGSRRETPETPNLRPLVWLFGSLVVSYFGARREPALGVARRLSRPSVSEFLFLGARTGASSGRLKPGGQAGIPAGASEGLLTAATPREGGRGGAPGMPPLPPSATSQG